MKETFHSRFGLLVSLIGLAVGTGNIWRFPRVMAQNGGGAFLIPWIIFLFLWSIPLLVVEFSLGKTIRKGVAGCFHELTDGKYTWLGCFVVLCTLGIMFYYSVVTGWCLYYAMSSFSGTVFESEPKLFWETFTEERMTPFWFHGLIVFLAAFVISRGIRKGIELFSVIFIPSLFLILLGLAVYSLTLSGRDEGLQFLFTFDFSKLKDYRVWLEALTQSAWSTGAGWGIVLTYACYSRPTDHPIKTPFITGFSNNTIEILAGIVIIPTLFSFFPLEEVLALTKEGSTGLTFISLPGLFGKMQAGKVLATLFFMGLFFAAFTSLLAMFEMGVLFLEDFGLSRKKGIFAIAFLGLLVGAPSALNMTIFDNQDWVWGVGLLLSGFFFSLLVRKIGIAKFAKECIGHYSPLPAKIFHFLIFWVIPLEFFALIGWWFCQAATWDPEGWWYPFRTFSVGTCLFQWGVLLGFLFFFNRALSKKIQRQ